MIIEFGVDLGHDVVVKKHVVLNSMSFVGGYTHIGERTYIAPGALLRDRIFIGRDAIVGLGSVVIHDVVDESIVDGNPAKRIGDNMDRKVFRRGKYPRSEGV